MSDVCGAGSCTNLAHITLPAGVGDSGACPAGTAKAGVGAGVCAPCRAGYYSGPTDGNCRPCPVGTFSGSAGSAECTACALAQLPAMTACPSAAQCGATFGAVVLDGAPTGVMPDGYAPPALLAGCALGAGATLSVFINDDCRVTLTTLGDPACSDPTAAGWADTQLHGFLYDADTLMSSVAPFNEADSGRTRCGGEGGGRVQGGAARGCMAALLARPCHQPPPCRRATVWRLRASGGATTLEFLPVDRSWVDTSGLEWLSASVTSFGVAPSSQGGACPAGTAGDASGCLPCQPGAACAGGAANVTCPANSYNPLLGASDAAADCLSCKADVQFGETWGSDAGSATCTDGAASVDCTGPNGAGAGGYVWDGDQNVCVACAAGSYQSEMNTCTHW